MNPYNIGYWSRVRKLNLMDIEEHPDLSKHVSGKEAKDEFYRGWVQADQEITKENFKRLLLDLENKT